jgi:hypothetical protein
VSDLEGVIRTLSDKEQSDYHNIDALLETHGDGGDLRRSHAVMLHTMAAAEDLKREAMLVGLARRAGMISQEGAVVAATNTVESLLETFFMMGYMLHESGYRIQEWCEEHRAGTPK